MISREEEIKQYIQDSILCSRPFPSHEQLSEIDGFREGIDWADNHPSNEAISKILNLWWEYRNSDEVPEEWGTNAKEACYNFIREHWKETLLNGEIKVK